jgi:hypothetical protein
MGRDGDFLSGMASGPIAAYRAQQNGVVDYPIEACSPGPKMSLQVVGIGSHPHVLYSPDGCQPGRPQEEGTNHEEVWIIRRRGSDRRGCCGDVHARRASRHPSLLFCRFPCVRCARYCGARKSISADHAGRPSARFYEACKSVPAGDTGRSAARSCEACKSISADHAGRPSARSFEACKSIPAGDTGRPSARFCEACKSIPAGDAGPRSRSRAE